MIRVNRNLTPLERFKLEDVAQQMGFKTIEKDGEEFLYRKNPRYQRDIYISIE